MSNDLRRARKEQKHSSVYKVWNYRGPNDFSAFDPDNILAGDNWDCNAESYVNVNDIEVYPGDLVIALVDNPGLLNEANLLAGKWRIDRKNIGTYGPKYSASDPGFLGQIAFDNDYFYICVDGGTAGNATWKKTNLQTT